VVAGVWMLVALVTTTSLTAGVASAFTVLQLDTTTIRNASDLAKRRVAAISGTTGARFAKEHGARVVGVTDLSNAVRAAEEGRADAVVHDVPILKYYLSRHPESELKLAAAAYDPQGYGFAVAPERDIVQRLNVALLSAKEDGRIRRIVATWLGE
jgi:polar amino acid transport system substrate-binding protein